MKPVVWTVPTGRSTFIPLGCIHWPIGERDLLKRWVERVKRAENGFTLLMGDSTDFARTHYRNHIRYYRDDQNSQEAIDEMMRREVRELAKELEPIKDKIIGAIRGNHWAEFLDGTNSEQYLCQLLGIRYLGAAGVIRLEFNDKSQSRHRMTIFAHHSGGSNGGRTTGGDVAALERIEGSFDADIYVAGHTHRRYATRLPVLTLTTKGEPKVIERTKVFIRCGALLKGFGPDNPSTSRQHIPSYAEEKCLRPTDLGWVELNLEVYARSAGATASAGRQSSARTCV